MQHLIGNLYAYGPCLYDQQEHILCLADLHLGYEKALLQQGITLPKTTYTQQRIHTILSSFPAPIHTLIINGDSKHNHGPDYQHQLTLLQRYAPHIVIIKGNHDNGLQQAVSEYKTKHTYYTHGDTLLQTPPQKHTNSITIVGHFHPAIPIGDGVRTELCKCFVLQHNIIYMPSFHTITIGKNIINDNHFTNEARIFTVLNDTQTVAWSTLQALRK
ncbi:MAG: metallophosphoesterase [Candidatus Woesearchaeota archaeon]